MFAWLDLAIALLKVVNAIINWAHDRKMIDEGRRQVIAENAAAISAKAKVRDEIRGEVDVMDKTQVDQELGDLGAPDSGKPGDAGTVRPRTGR